MAVQRRLNILSQQRIDCPDLRSIESAASNDWDQYVQAVMTGTAQGYIMRGFSILMAGAIGNTASNLQMKVDPGSVMHIAASQSGTVLMVPPGTPAQQLNASVNTNVTGAFISSSVNYVTLDYIRFIDPSTAAQVYLWDPSSNTETTTIAPRAQILEFVINISTATPTPNQLMIAIVLTDASNLVLSITDSRWMYCSLETGGLAPNPNYSYPWTQGRTQPPVTSTSDSQDPFNGGDKNLGSLKDWMNAVMTTFKEITGNPEWFNVGATFSSNIRGFVGDTVAERIGYLTDAIGDEQEDRTAVIMSDTTVSWIGGNLTFTDDIVFQIINAKMGGITNHIVLAANSPLVINPGELVYITIDRFVASEDLVPVVTSAPLPAQTELNKDIIVLFENLGGNLWMPFMKQMVVADTTFTIGEVGGGSSFDVNTILTDRITGAVLVDRTSGDVIVA